MAWFKQARKPIAATKEKASRVPEGLWVKCAGCAQVIYNKDLATQPERLPEVRASFPHRRRRTAAHAVRRRTWTEYDKELVSTDPLKFTDTKPYSTRLEVEHRGHRAQGRGDRRRRDASTASRRSSPRWSTRSSAAAWASSSAKRSRAPSNAPSSDRWPMVIVCCSGGARMMEGALSLMQMAKISRRARPPRPRAAALHRGAHRSDHRRRDGELRDARRPEHRRTQGADRLRRTARHRADHPAEAARRIPARRVPAREGHDRSGRRSPRDEGGHRQSARFMGACGRRRVGRRRPSTCRGGAAAEPTRAAAVRL